MTIQRTIEELTIADVHSAYLSGELTATDLVDAYRNRFAHHGFHPFTVWYWATYPLRYLSDTILVGPRDGRAAKRLGVSWAPSLDRALAMAREKTGGDDVAALTIPPFMYLSVDGKG